MDCRASNGRHPRPAVRRRPLRQVLPHSSEQQAVARHHTPVLGPPGEAPPPGYRSCTPTGRFRGHGRGPLSAKSGIRGHPRGAKGGIFRAGTGRNGVFWSRSTVWQPTGRPPNPAARCSHRKYRDGEIPRAALNLLHLAVEISARLARVCVRSRPIPACADRALAGNRDRSVQQRPTSLERPRGRHRSRPSRFLLRLPVAAG
jgi:hypothetical protein